MNLENTISPQAISRTSGIVVCPGGGRLTIFKEQHPKTIRFLTDVAQNAVREGTVIEMKVTDPDGKDYVSNFRITTEDMETLDSLKNLQEE